MAVFVQRPGIVDGHRSEVVCSIAPDPILVSPAHRVTFPPDPGLGSSDSKSIFSVVRPVGTGRSDTCW